MRLSYGRRRRTLRRLVNMKDGFVAWIANRGWEEYVEEENCGKRRGRTNQFDPRPICVAGERSRHSESLPVMQEAVLQGDATGTCPAGDGYTFAPCRARIRHPLFGFRRVYLKDNGIVQATCVCLAYR